jgi:hypothetical protein
MATAQRSSGTQASSFDDRCVPIRVASDDEVHAARLDARARWMLSFVDGRSVLGHVISTSGLPVEDARDGVSELVLRGLVVLETVGGSGWSQGRT